MAVPTLITDLSTTAATNSPAGSENVFPNLDDYLRAQSAFLASVRDNSGNGWVSPYLPLAGGTMTGTVAGLQVSSLNGGQLAGLRNKIINGACQVAQRGNIAAVLGTWTYGGADRILVLPFAFTTATGTIAQISGYGSSGFAQSVALTTTGSGSVNFESRLEYRNVIGLNSNTVTFSVKVYQDTGSSVSTTLGIYKATAQDNFTGKTLLGSLSSVSVVSSTTTVLTYTLALGSTDASNGLSVQINFNSVGAVTSKTFLVTDLQLEVGPVATPFEQIPIGLSLQLCQRYYAFYTAIGPQRSTTVCDTYVNSPVVMRTTPSVFTYGTATIEGTGVPAGQSTVTTGSNSYFFRFETTFTAAGAVGTPCSQSITASAEL